MTVNHTLAIGKGRNAAGAGIKIAFDFDPNTLRNLERGIVVKRKRRQSSEPEVLPVLGSA